MKLRHYGKLQVGQVLPAVIKPLHEFVKLAPQFSPEVRTVNTDV